MCNEINMTQNPVPQSIYPADSIEAINRRSDNYTFQHVFFKFNWL